MPLPANWSGVFWGPETMGNMLVDRTPDSIMEFLDDYPDNPAFLVGGAVFDLRLNGMTDRAEQLLAAADKRWPTALWKQFGEFIETGVRAYQGLNPARQKASSSVVYSAIGAGASEVLRQIHHRARS